MRPLRLGELLVKRGLISPAQLEEALSVQKSNGEFLGAILVRKGWLTEEQLLSTLSEQSGIPRLRWDDTQVDWSAAGSFSSSLMSEHICFPIRQDDISVTVAISNPLDAWVMSALQEQARGRRVKFVLAATWEIKGAIQRHYQRAIQKIQKSMEGDSHGK